LLNAAFNARDAMPDGGRLTLSTSNVPGDDGDFICIALADTGQGMPAEVLDRAFEPFFTTKPIGKGTGLGLSQIHGFAAQSGGRAEIDSPPGAGTTVRILLPRSDRSPAAPPEREPAPRPRPGLTILLVEDNPHVLAFAGQLLGELDCRVLAAPSGEAALVLLDNDERIDLLFTDVVMPGLSGVAVAQAARERVRGLPVILATGYSDEILGSANAEYEILRKPYDSASLAAAIVAALESARGRKLAPAAS
jgi:CheY-like chemotaxis protein